MARKDLSIMFVGDSSEPSIANSTFERFAALIPDRRVEVGSVDTDHWEGAQLVDAISATQTDDLILLPMTSRSGLKVQSALESAGLKGANEWWRVRMNGKSLNVYVCSSIFKPESIPIIAYDRVSEALSKGVCSEFPEQRMRSDEIYQDSFNKVRSLIEPYLSGKSDLERQLVVRVVHAAADGEIAERVCYSKDAITAGLHAIAGASEILVDTEMVKAGVYDPGIRAFGCKVKCYLYDDRTKRIARHEGITKTAAAVRVAVKDGVSGDLVAFGNSPTAVIELVRMVKTGKAEPSLVVASPCGFVNAVESKEMVTRLAVPWITVTGSKGGSAVAASIVNFLASTARKMRGE